MMTCKDVHGEIRRYLDGTMPWGLRMRVRMHLMMCRDCRRYVTQLRQADVAVVAANEVPEPTEALERRLLEIFRAERARGGESGAAPPGGGIDAPGENLGGGVTTDEEK